MAWTTPITWSTGQIVTGIQLNEQVRDNESYLKTEVDKIDDISFVSHTATTRALATNYQASTKIRFVTAHVTGTVNAGVPAMAAYIGSTSPAATYVRGQGAEHIEATNEAKGISIGFIVPPTWYYRVIADAPLAFYSWSEWDLL